MSIGSMLVGLAAAVLVAVYVARPFRQSHADFDKVLEAWVAEAEKSPPAPRQPAPPPPPVVSPPPPDQAPTSQEVINFCPQCGQKVQPEHRFCPGCGTRLRA